MSSGSENNVVYWPRVKEILDTIMHQWEEKWAGKDSRGSTNTTGKLPRT